MSDDAIGLAIAANDLDGLNRLVDAFCESRDWGSLLRLRDRSRAAFERGFQLWPAAAHAAYRLALEAPGEFAALVLDDRGGDFAYGPLAEVAATRHRWAELARWAPPSPAAALCAYECVARGEDLRDVELTHADLFDVPLFRCGWEPDYLVADYRRDGATFPSPHSLHGRERVVGSGATRIDQECGVALDALLGAVRPWQAESGATLCAVAVEGNALGAIGALTQRGVRVAALSPAEALEWLAWAGASSGPHGRRRGLAAGRDVAWHAVAALAGIDSEEAIDPHELGVAVAELNWYWWQTGDISSGWVLRIAVEDPGDGVAFALDAHVLATTASA